MRPGGGTRRITESDSTDLPQPDSPTMPSVRPRATETIDAVHRGDLAVGGAEGGAQRVDGEQRRDFLSRAWRERVG